MGERKVRFSYGNFPLERPRPFGRLLFTWANRSVHGLTFWANGKHSSGLQILSRKRVYHLHKWVPLTEKRRRRPETAIKGGLKKWNSLSVGNFPSGKHGTTFSYVPLLPWIFHWIDTKIRVHLHPDRNSRNLLVQNECWWKAPVALRLLSNRILEAFRKIVNKPCWSLLYELIVKTVTVVFFLLVALSFSNGWSAFLLSNPHGPWWLA